MLGIVWLSSVAVNLYQPSYLTVDGMQDMPFSEFHVQIELVFLAVRIHSCAISTNGKVVRDLPGSRPSMAWASSEEARADSLLPPVMLTLSIERNLHYG